MGSQRPGRTRPGRTARPAGAHCLCLLRVHRAAPAAGHPLRNPAPSPFLDSASSSASPRLRGEHSPSLGEELDYALHPVATLLHHGPLLHRTPRLRASAFTPNPPWPNRPPPSPPRTTPDRHSPPKPRSPPAPAQASPFPAESPRPRPRRALRDVMGIVVDRPHRGCDLIIGHHHDPRHVLPDQLQRRQIRRGHGHAIRHPRRRRRA